LAFAWPQNHISRRPLAGGHSVSCKPLASFAPLDVVDDAVKAAQGQVGGVVVQ
jgi:hypothetical protein